MALDIQERNPVVQGAPVVNPNDQLFWFKRPRLILHLIHFSLFESAFQLAFFFWAWYEYGLKSCFHKQTVDIVVRVSLGITVQIVCSYVTLPLYALVTQMGTNMKPTVFGERIATSLKKWRQRAKKKLKGKQENLSSRPTKSPERSSPLHLLHNYNSVIETESLEQLEQFEHKISNIEAVTDTPSSYQSQLNTDNDFKEEIHGGAQDAETNGSGFTFHLSKQR
ncbi:hypothetical protein SUGI_1096330 [Cryptomeria japonica]|nr:hypothetical protein SUGI_1096330 [Cryptomeria japonica]